MGDPLAAGGRLHFMGIGGIGMSALARLARARGLAVDGCDRSESAQTRALAAAGISVRIGHDASHVAEFASGDWLVHTSATPPDHPERLAAGPPRSIRRGDLLARMMDASPLSIGICGTHGKTTTTWILAHLLIESGFDPTVALGGTVRGLGGNWRSGSGPFVAELDESDGSFLASKPAIGVVANVESDHLAHYGDVAALRKAFFDFADRTASAGGRLYVNIDDGGARALAAGAGRRVRLSVQGDADVHARELGSGEGGRVFRLTRHGADAGEYRLPLPGRHNLSNAVAALAVALDLGAAPDALAAALGKLTGVDRRLQRVGRCGRAAIYSDYAHHPTEIRAGVEALRELHSGPIRLVFQPHLYSRTRDYAEDFGRALALADEVLLVDIYPAREAPIPGVDSTGVVEAARAAGGRAVGPAALGEVEAWVRGRAEESDAIALMGAGDIDSVAERLGSAQEAR